MSYYLCMGEPVELTTTVKANLLRRRGMRQYLKQIEQYPSSTYYLRFEWAEIRSLFSSEFVIRLSGDPQMVGWATGIIERNCGLEQSSLLTA